MKNKLVAIRLLRVLEIIKDDWMAIQVFEKNGKPVWVSGFGRTREEALHDFYVEFEIENSY